MGVRAAAIPRPSDDAQLLILRVAGLALAYFLAAKLGLRLAYSNENVTSVWPPTGIAVAALVLLGPKLWPGVTLGAILANLSNSAGAGTSIGIAAGNTLAPLLAVTLLRRGGFDPALHRLRDVLGLVFLGGLASMLVSATGGVVALSIAGDVGSLASTWLVWWVGDALGVVLFAPLILTFATKEKESSPFLARPWEAVALFTGASIASLLVFSTHVPLAHLVFPFAIWTAVRFSPRGASALTVLVSVIAIVQTVNGHGPFSMLNRTTNLLSLQTFNAAVALASLSLAAVIAERRVAQVALRGAADELEDRVAVRTEQLASSEERMSEAQALAHIGSWRWDVAADTVAWSDELYRIYGLEPQGSPATFQAYIDHVHPEHREQVLNAVRGTLETGRSFDHSYRVVRPNGEVRWVHARGEVVVDPALRKTVGLRGFCHDVTERKEIEDAMRSALEGERDLGRKLRLLDEFKDSLLTAVSHELRTPLTVIIGLASTLQRPVTLPADEQRDLMRRLEANAHRLDSLLMDLLDVDRLNRGVIEPRPRATGLEGVVLRALESLDVHDHPFTVEVGDVAASVDPAHAERIAENLLANAAKHTPPGTHVWIRADRDAEGVTLIVDDAGPGVPEAIRDAVFEPFRRGDGASNAPGTGVGLALVARFARLNGGRAWVEERSGGGASFRVLFPAATVPPPES